MLKDIAWDTVLFNNIKIYAFPIITIMVYAHLTGRPRKTFRFAARKPPMLKPSQANPTQRIIKTHQHVQGFSSKIEQRTTKAHQNVQGFSSKTHTKNYKNTSTCPRFLQHKPWTGKRQYHRPDCSIQWHRHTHNRALTMTTCESGRVYRVATVTVTDY